MRSAAATKEVDWAQALETALTAPGNLGDTYNRFYTYSYMNQVLLLMQGVQEPVATYNRWQALGRQVMRGSKAYEIIRPITIKREDDDGEEVRITRFKPVRCLFGYSQTEGDELPPPPVTPHWSVSRALDSLDIRQVPFRHLDGNTQGVSWHRNLAVNPMAKYPLKTTLHEMAHIVSGHTSDEQLDDYEQHRGVKEFEAEASAYLVGNELGVLSDAAASVSRAYIQSWLGDELPPEASIRRVFATTDSILKAGRLALGFETPIPAPSEQDATA